MADEDKPPPWHANGVKGVVPPGRKLGKKSPAKAAAPWRATGVRGIRLDENRDEDEALDQWRMKRSAFKKPSQAKEPTRSKAPSKPKETKTEKPGPNLKLFLDEIAAFFREHPPEQKSHEMLAELIGQSHAPYEITLGFTVLSALVGQDTEQRNKYAWALERGARAFFNLAMRLDKTVKAPRGLAPQRLDPLFYDLPATAFQIPYAFATDAFLRIIELVQGEHAHNQAVNRFGKELYEKHIQGHRYGDQSLAELFGKPDFLDEN